MDMYGSFAAVYDEFMDNVPYGPWSRKIIELLKKYGIEDGLVLDLCCGTGNMTERLAQAGYDMIGVDSSVEMLQIAEEKKLKTGHDILYLNQDMRTFELYGTVRAIVCVCDSLNYLLSENDLQKVFRLAYNYLDPDGIFIFDMNTLHKYRSELGCRTIAEKRDDCSFIWDNWWDEEQKINEYDLTLFVQTQGSLCRRFDEIHYQKGYEINTVTRRLKEAGFSLLGVKDTDTWGSLTDETGRVTAAARKRECREASES